MNKIKNKIHIAIFASGGGSNAEVLIQHFEKITWADISLVCTNNSEAGVIRRAAAHKINCTILKPLEYRDGKFLTDFLHTQSIELVVLAGYLKFIPSQLIHAYPKRIINVHPALLPDFGGKGMYGMNVHRAVIESQVSHSGPTIHYVNEAYDEGEIIFQAKVKIQPEWTARELQQAVLRLEHKYFSEVVEKIAWSLFPEKEVKN